MLIERKTSEWRAGGREGRVVGNGAVDVMVGTGGTGVGVGAERRVRPASGETEGGGGAIRDWF